MQEYNNDIELNNPYTGKKGLWAPDPDPAFPNPKLRPNVDALSIPSNFRPLPGDLAAQVVQVNDFFFKFISSRNSKKLFRIVTFIDSYRIVTTKA